MSVRKHCQLFTHEWNTSWFKEYPNQTNCKFVTINPQNLHFPLQHMDTHLMHPSLNRPHSVHHSNDSSIGSRTSGELRNKVPIGYNWKPQIHHQNCPLSFDDHHLHLLNPSLDRPTHNSKRHPDPVSRFATIHFPDRQTDRQIGIGDNYSKSAYALLY